MYPQTGFRIQYSVFSIMTEDETLYVRDNCSIMPAIVLSSLPRLLFSSNLGDFVVNTIGKDEVLPRF